jgi:hypothetical protein
MANNLRCSWDEWGRNWRRKCKNISWSTICTHIVLISAKLSTLGGDALQIFLSRGVGITNLKKETFLTNRLTMELEDNFFTNITALESVRDLLVLGDRNCNIFINHSPSKSNATTIVLRVTKNSARLNSIIHEYSTKFLSE